ncbi:MAG: hypothetical protein ACLVJO_06080 [[Clostridium] scindens]
MPRAGRIVNTVHKGSFVACANQNLMLEEKKKIEADLEKAIRKGRSCGMSNQEITELFNIVWRISVMLRLENVKKHYGDSA